VGLHKIKTGGYFLEKTYSSLRVGVFGHSSSTHLTDSILKWVELFGEFLASKKAVLYTGGGGGIMLAVRQGCIKKGGTAISVNPEININGKDVESNYLGNVIATGQGKLGRVHLLSQSIDIGFALGGGAGTLMEIVACYLLAKPIIVVKGFQKETDPDINTILSRVEEKEYKGQTILSGYVDGKDVSQVCPVTLCPSALSPEEVFSLGIRTLELQGEKNHKMGY
jgi:uncharacterized protein (TIGR00725 family)